MIKRLGFAIAAIGGAMFAQTPLKTCTVANIRGVPVAGTFCGGAAVAAATGCSPGVLYTCKAGPAGTKNNCTLSQVCATACMMTLETGSAACFTGAAPFTVTPLSTPGGSDINLNVNVAASHTGAIINLKVDRGDLVPGQFCAVPALPNTQSTVSFGLSTAVVSAPRQVQLYTDIPYGNPAGNTVELVSRAQVLTLNPGGSEPPPPPISSFTLVPTSIGPAGIGFAEVSLARRAPASGVKIALTSSNPAVASIIDNGEPFVLGSCTDAQVAENIQAANSTPQTTVVEISASSGAPGQAPVTRPLTVTSGCVPISCSGGPSCGPQPNGCGGTMTCGCADSNQTCGGGGVPNQCGAQTLAVSSLTLNPTTVASGASSTGIVTLNLPAPLGGALIPLSSNNSLVTVPIFVSVPSGQTSVSFPVSTTRFSAGTITATISASNGAANALLTVTAAASCAPTTCAAQGKTCGTIPDGCGGVLTCGGACTGSATITVAGTGKGGKITSSPSGINVSSGKTASAPFNVGSSVTLMTDDGHGAIWSGLCNSSGRATQSCTFTVSASGTITSNQQ